MNEDRDIDDIRRDIEDTRVRISSEIEAIEDKLTPAHAREVVKDRVREKMAETRDRVTNRLGESADNVADSVRDASARIENVAENMRDSASRIGVDVASTIRANPVPIALIGIGTGWLVWQTVRARRRDIVLEVEPLFEIEGVDIDDTESMLAAQGFVEDESERVGADLGIRGDGERIRGRMQDVKERASGLAQGVRGRAHGAREKVSGIAHDARDRTSHLAHDARERARVLAQRGKGGVQRAGSFTGEAFHANPIAFATLALAAGIGVAMMLPHTRREDRLLGPARERVLDRARRLADDARQVAMDSVREGASAAKDTARRELDEGRLDR